MSPKLEELIVLGEKRYNTLQFLISKSDGRLIYTGADIEKEGMKVLDISKSTYYQRIKSLEEKGIIVKKTRGVYQFTREWYGIILNERRHRSGGTMNLKEE